ncbi:MAG TPA: MarR family transcriptional regulator [Candidatus Hydrogenedentes bacterium]|nr:MarR family transcriptional regulator [Candidatus Hydrogenedentota bacterium]HNZ17364.1 MarR family transcriptional regulator [Candidatus Hydrogenedentota bacterium]HOH33170.1 MarR family transcriptional regulator [Candidatus Hydrogenedentota bacterium]HPV38128.1 MarR family transcriptional regulator [Candidatus Hydrogenedentota bacterium]HQE76331.1 MarR family transcriptional regulator [Candidatus Hydrogenedentota bacterium]
MALQNELDLDLPFDDIRHEAMLGILRTATLASILAGKMLRQFGLTEAQFNVLFALKYKTRAITQVELGRRLVVTRATVTSVLDKLESKGYVERRDVPDNRRSYHVELTRAGRQVVDALEPVYRDTIHDVLGHLSESEVQRLIGMLEPVRARLRELANAGENGESAA